MNKASPTIQQIPPISPWDHPHLAEQAAGSGLNPRQLDQVHKRAMWAKDGAQERRPTKPSPPSGVNGLLPSHLVATLQ